MPRRAGRARAAPGPVTGLLTLVLRLALAFLVRAFRALRALGLAGRRPSARLRLGLGLRARFRWALGLRLWLRPRFRWTLWLRLRPRFRWTLWLRLRTRLRRALRCGSLLGRALRLRSRFRRTWWLRSRFG